MGILEKIDNLAKGAKTFTASALFMALQIYASSKGIDLTVYTGALEQTYAVLVDAFTSVEAAYAAIVVILRQAMPDKQKLK